MSTNDDAGDEGDHTEDAVSFAGRYATSLTIAAVATVVAVIWAVAVLADLGGDIRELPRTEVPGELTIEVDEPTEPVVYDERRTWVTPIDDPDLEVEVTGPDGETVDAAPYGGIMNYRWWRTVGQARATFEATQPGTYEVSIDGDLPDDARATIGPNFTTTLLTLVIGPLVVLVAGLLLAAVVAAYQASRRGRSGGSSGGRR